MTKCLSPQDFSTQIEGSFEIPHASAFPLVFDNQKHGSKTSVGDFQMGVASIVDGKRLSDRSAKSAAVAMPGSF